ncbi:MAG: hypothetical protein M1826_003420 [Phylliscum demangeonii]|nr:MAG: hypothetical protein M1826_003420 [Phylliscum demangeonii]
MGASQSSARPSSFHGFKPERDIPDLSGKVILVTGGNTGLGKESVLQLAKHRPAHIFLGARNAAKGHAAIADIHAAVPDARITFLPLDLSSFASIAAAAQTFHASSDRLDILMHNAGIMAVPAGTTTDGYEIQLGTNHLGPALLTKLLLPTLLKTAAGADDVRIVNLSSFGHNGAPSTGIDFEDTHLPTSSVWTRYGQSKLANILFSRELARRYPPLTSVAVHPGFVRTDLINSVQGDSALIRYGYKLFGGLIYTHVADGARNQLWAAAGAPRDALVNGAYYTPVGVKNAGSKWARDDALADRLWRWTLDELAKHGY